MALARCGGLRCPQRSAFSLRWEDIDWQGDCITVHSPKTEHHVGKESRIILLFPELRPILTESFERALDGAVYVVDERYLSSAKKTGGWANTNLRTQFQRIVKRAGLKTWPRLFHNLRASRETELAESFSVQVVASWLGNTPSIALRHYLMTMGEHFQVAVRADEAAQKAAQQLPAASGKQQQSPSLRKKKPPDLLSLASYDETLQVRGMEGRGHQ
ncbi:MAG: site-specific integrase [Pirellulales bacterium]|nr:site-specific integrase [Pirellulales bacterium]